MSRTEIPVTPVTRAGILPAAENNGDVANNHFFVNNGKTVLLVRNAGGSAFTVTAKFSVLVDGQPITNRVVSLAAAASKYLGPFPISEFGTSVQVDVDAGSATNLKLSAYSVS